LESISVVLAKYGVDSVWVQGNVMQKNKAIREFKSTTVRVIMLSLQNAASGTNLMEANYIIMMDALDGTKEEVTSVEKQAIGRAHRQGQKNTVTIVRFIIKNTVEHSLYVKIYGTGSMFSGHDEVVVCDVRVDLLVTIHLFLEDRPNFTINEAIDIDPVTSSTTSVAVTGLLESVIDSASSSVPSDNQKTKPKLVRGSSKALTGVLSRTSSNLTAALTQTTPSTAMPTKPKIVHSNSISTLLLNQSAELRSSANVPKMLEANQDL